MRLATLDDDSRDGHLVVVDQTGDRYASAADIVPTLQAALDDWSVHEGPLRALAAKVEAGLAPTQSIDPDKLLAPLPRAYEWIDGSAYINHIVLVRKARGAEPPPTLRTEPLVYQGGSGRLLGPRSPISTFGGDAGLDFEGEICVVLGDVPQGTKAEDAEQYIRLVLLCNDVSLRSLIPGELSKGFGFFVSKPATAFSPLAVTPDVLGDAWQGGRLHLPLEVTLNEKRMGFAHAGSEMHFSFYDLIEHVTRTRSLTAGTILGSGTVSNQAPETGVSCLAERRMEEIIANGEATTPFLQHGDRVQIRMRDAEGTDLFGTICQDVR